MQCGFSKQMLATPLNGRVSELFQLDTNAIVSFGGGREKRLHLLAHWLLNWCSQGGHSHGYRLSPSFLMHSMVNYYSRNQKPVDLEENCYACICPCAQITVFAAQH